MGPMPTVNQAYAMVISDESQKSIAANAGLLGANLTFGTGQYDVAMYTKTEGNFQKTRKNFNLFSEFCKMKGHSKETCYKIVGYPPEYRPRNKSTNTHSAYNVLSDMSIQKNQLPKGNWNENNSQNSQLTSSVVSTNSSHLIGQVNNNSWLGNYTFTKEQYDHIVQLLSKDNSISASATPSANAAGIPYALLTSDSLQEWIIDTGATNHMVADLELLNKVSLVQTSQPKKVHLPNGETTQVTHIGTSTLSDQNTITNVFYIPQFKYNLLSVSKVTKELKCSVAFFPDFCVFQELFSGRVKAIGREDIGLYILSRQTIPGSNTINLNTMETEVNKETSSSDIDLWHRRLGHVSTTVFKKLLSEKIQDMSARIDLYSIFPCAKQTRHPFLVSSIRTTASFELVHMDLWGPYKVPTMDVCGNLFNSLGVIHQKPCPYTPQQNRVAERKYRHILELTRAITFQAEIPIKFWGYCVLVAVYLINRLPSSIIDNKSPYERLYSRKPALQHLKISIIQPSIVQTPQTAPTNLSDQPDIRKSGRGKKSPIWMKDFVSLTAHHDEPYAISKCLTYEHLTSKYQAYLTAASNIIEPTFYSEAVKDPKWVDAMKAEIEAL
uniref:Integrase catalytic domain-containing protein n=1 Tax=Nicotiana tabacum TaxID=4097 RepID=A0A1S4A2A9_TOBAC|nr:PREDICTED: uncharacterized protein LOC107793056 [Nicotiana tabacum]